MGPSERLREASDGELVAAREQLLAVVEAAEKIASRDPNAEESPFARSVVREFVEIARVPLATLSQALEPGEGT